MTKTRKIVYWIATLWLSLGMTSTGIVQILKTKGQTGPGGLDSVVTHLGYPTYFLTLIGICKLLGVIAILVPKFPLLKEWAYAGFFFLLMGAIVSHIAVGQPVVEAIPSAFLLVLGVLSWYLRPASRKIISVNQPASLTLAEA